MRARVPTVCFLLGCITGAGVTAQLTERLINKLTRPPQDVEVRAARCRGLVLRLRASGRHTYRFQAGRGRWVTIGQLDDFTIDEARLEADSLRGDSENMEKACQAPVVHDMMGGGLADCT